MSGSAFYPVSVKGVLIRGGCVLLLLNERDEWDLPGGRPDPGEDHRAALAREVLEETGLAAGVLGHPAMAVAWLANKLAPFDVTLEPGHMLLSGSFTRPVWAKKGDTLHADFGPLGSVAVQFV